MTVIVTNSHCWDQMSVYYKYELKDLRRNYIIIILRYTLLNLFLFSMVQTKKETNKFQCSMSICEVTEWYLRNLFQGTITEHQTQLETPCLRWWFSIMSLLIQGP